VLEHPGHLDDAAQLDLAPAAADVRAVAEGADEVAGLAAELLLRLGEAANLRRELRVRPRPRDLELLEPAVDLRERLLQRRHEVLDRLPALLEVGGRLLLQLLELRLRELEERPVARRERVGGQRLQRHLEGAPRVFEHAELRRVLRAREEPGARGADDDPCENGCDDHRARER
jgi:hypothetical protein